MPDGLDKLEAYMRETLGVEPDVARPDSERSDARAPGAGRRLIASIRGRLARAGAEQRPREAPDT